MFYSVLFPTEESAALPRRKKMPDAFSDLQLDFIMKRCLGEYMESGLEDIYYTPVTDPAVLRYRQEILRELEDPAVRESVLAIVERFGSLREVMDGLRDRLETGRQAVRSGGPGVPRAGSSALSFLVPKKTEDWLDMGRVLERLSQFTDTLSEFAGSVRSMTLRSEGLRRFGDYVADYCESDRFREMDAEAKRLRACFDDIRYCLWFRTDTSAVKVLPFEEREDYASRITALFDRFRQGTAQDFRRNLDEAPVSEKLENEILQLLSRRYPREFSDLRVFCDKYLRFDDDAIVRFAREVRFYLCWLEMMRPLREAGLSFCYPVLRDGEGETRAEDCFDLALALRKPGGIVTNGFFLTPPEQILVVTGPNQGGKSTFARAFGQVHYLASLGLTVPGRAAELRLCDGVLTHFERKEGAKDLDGKLREDLVRLKKLLDAATSRTVVVVNEIFASTTAWDALVLSRKMLDVLTAKGAPGVVVTFLDELADYGPQTVSMAAEVSPDEKKTRSFRILRRKPGGRSYAEILAERHGLGYEEIKRRVRA